IDEPAIHTRPNEDFDLAVEAMHLAVDGIDAEFHTHICYGEVEKIYPDMLRLPVKQIHLAFMNTDFEYLKLMEQTPFDSGKDLGVGVTDIHTRFIEKVEDVKDGIRRTLKLFHPRSVAIAGVSTQQPGFAGVGMGFLLSLMELRFPAVYPVNPKYQEIEGLRCYASVLDIDGPVDHVISSVPARIVPQLAEDCIAKGVRSVHFFTAGFRETGDDEMADRETQVVGRLTGSGIGVFGANCMGLYVPES